MTGQIETATTKQNPWRWQKLLGSLSAFEQAMIYNPLEHNYATIRYLWQKLEQLESLVNELQGRDQSAVSRRA